MGVGDFPRDRVPAGDLHGPRHAGRGEVLLGRGARGGGIDAEVATFDGGRRLHPLAAGAGGVSGDVGRALLGVDLAAEVDREADEPHHHEGRGDHPQRDRPAFVPGSTTVSGEPVHARSRNVSIGLVMVAETRRLPGTAGTDRSDRSIRHWTRTDSVAASPTVRVNWFASTVTSMSRQWTPSLDRLVVAALVAAARAELLVRSIEAARAASAAAGSTDWRAVAARPPKMMRPTNSTKAGAPTAASTAADPRSSLESLRRRITVPSASLPSSTRVGPPSGTSRG